MPSGNSKVTLAQLVVSSCGLLLTRAGHVVGFAAVIAGLVESACLLFKLVRMLAT